MCLIVNCWYLFSMEIMSISKWKKAISKSKSKPMINIDNFDSILIFNSKPTFIDLHCRVYARWRRETFPFFLSKLHYAWFCLDGSKSCLDSGSVVFVSREWPCIRTSIARHNFTKAELSIQLIGCFNEKDWYYLEDRKVHFLRLRHKPDLASSQRILHMVSLSWNWFHALKKYIFEVIRSHCSLDCEFMTLYKMKYAVRTSMWFCL